MHSSVVMTVCQHHSSFASQLCYLFIVLLRCHGGGTFFKTCFSFSAAFPSCHVTHVFLSTRPAFLWRRPQEAGPWPPAVAVRPGEGHHRHAVWLQAHGKPTLLWWYPLQSHLPFHQRLHRATKVLLKVNDVVKFKHSKHFVTENVLL